MARGEVTGRKPEVTLTTPKLAFSIPEFCAAHGISRAHYFKMRKLGLGPVEMEFGDRKLISVEAAAAWRRDREQAA